MTRTTINPAGRATGGASNCLGDSSQNSTAALKTQASVRAIEAGLVCLPDACDAAFILRRRLDLPERLWLATSSLLSLPPDDVELLAEAALYDLRAGPPIPPFTALRAEARDWAFYASRGERCHYMAAAWGELGDDDRRRFLRRAL